MNLERYPYINSNGFQDYEFYSDGQKDGLKNCHVYKNPQFRTTNL